MDYEASKFAEIKKFIMRGNVPDLAIGVIIGAAFGKIVTSLVNDIIMPPIELPQPPKNAHSAPARSH